MIFAHTLDKVLSGEKSQTRRIAKLSEELYKGEEIYVCITGKRRIYQVGKSYAAQPNRGQKAVARVEITNIRREQIIDITEEDAWAEGFASRQDFFAVWKIIHGSKANLHQDVWVLEFKLLLPYFSAGDLAHAANKRRISEDKGTYNGDDLPAAVPWLSGAGLHSGRH